MTLDRWQKFQNDNGKWADSVFGNRMYNTEGHSTHLMKEVIESAKKPQDLEEYADCFILLIDKMRNEGFTMRDLYNASVKKLEINKKRKWGNPDKDGIIEHEST